MTKYFHEQVEKLLEFDLKKKTLGGCFLRDNKATGMKASTTTVRSTTEKVL